ncbi:RHOMBOID-like protein [Actinidia chinensis var. chinensis]|uniref:RHOMBOID-like protein n=1 Tax=Actinidia chinensis var. chinensis TaxID=1590841 RepID=A0A2R6RU94_ACTCC|nr:RHOMBOID-like protein [Actinidia chinensis var. chinensis]
MLGGQGVIQHCFYTKVSMAVVPICYNMGYKDQSLLNPKEVKHNEKGFMCSFNAVQENCCCFSPLSSDSGRRGLNDSTGILLKFSKRKSAGFFHGEGCNRGFMPSNMTEVSVQSLLHKVACHLRSIPSNDPEREKLYVLCHASKSSLNQKQLESLDTYFRKLKQDANRPSSVSLNKTEEFVDHSGTVTAKRVLVSLEHYLGKVKKDNGTTEAPSYSARVNSGSGEWNKLKGYTMLKNRDGEGPKSSYNETSDLYLINILVSMNIAVFLFGIASPIQKSDLEHFSLPLAYGAKINHLILLGEWWRLVTPMFLVQE